MEIPKKFSLFGSEYTVGIEKDLINVKGLEGIHSYRKKHIRLQEVCSGHNKETQEHAFLHELIHAILTQMSEFNLNENEKFVDIFAGLLHQSQKTSEYTETLTDGIEEHMKSQPYCIVCSSCGNYLPFTREVDSEFGLSLNVERCGCE